MRRSEYPSPAKTANKTTQWFEARGVQQNIFQLAANIISAESKRAFQEAETLFDRGVFSGEEVRDTELHRQPIAFSEAYEALVSQHTVSHNANDDQEIFLKIAIVALMGAHSEKEFLSHVDRMSFAMNYNATNILRLFFNAAEYFAKSGDPLRAGIILDNNQAFLEGFFKKREINSSILKYFSSAAEDAENIADKRLSRAAATLQAASSDTANTTEDKNRYTLLAEKCKARLTEIVDEQVEAAAEPLKVLGFNI